MGRRQARRESTSQGVCHCAAHSFAPSTADCQFREALENYCLTTQPIEGGRKTYLLSPISHWLKFTPQALPIPTKTLWPSSKKSDFQDSGNSTVCNTHLPACLCLVTKRSCIFSHLSSLRKPQGWRLGEHEAMSDVRQHEGSGRAGIVGQAS